MVLSECGGTGVLFIAHKVGFACLGHLFFFSVLGRFFSQNQCERELKKKKVK